MKDIYGKELKRGNFVAYGVNYSNGGGLRIGIIVDVRETDDEKMTIKVLTVSKWSHYKLAPRAVWTGASNMLRVDRKELDWRVANKLEDWLYEYVRR